MPALLVDFNPSRPHSDGMTTPTPKKKIGRPRKLPKGRGKRYAIRFEVTGSYAHKRMLENMRREVDGRLETNQDIIRRLIEDEAARDPLGSGGSGG